MNVLMAITPLRGKWLGVFLALLFLRQLAWMLTVPMFQAPDEVVHLQMAAQMDRHGVSFYTTESPSTWQNFEESFDFRSDYYGEKGMIWHWDKKQPFTQNSRVGPGELERLHTSVIVKSSVTICLPSSW